MAELYVIHSFIHSFIFIFGWFMKKKNASFLCSQAEIHHLVLVDENETFFYEPFGVI